MCDTDVVPGGARMLGWGHWLGWHSVSLVFTAPARTEVTTVCSPNYK